MKPITLLIIIGMALFLWAHDGYGEETMRDTVSTMTYNNEFLNFTDLPKEAITDCHKKWAVYDWLCDKIGENLVSEPYCERPDCWFDGKIYIPCSFAAYTTFREIEVEPYEEKKTDEVEWKYMVVNGENITSHFYLSDYVISRDCYDLFGTLQEAIDYINNMYPIGTFQGQVYKVQEVELELHKKTKKIIEERIIEQQYTIKGEEPEWKNIPTCKSGTTKKAIPHPWPDIIQ